MRASILRALLLSVLAGFALAQDYYPFQTGLSWTYDNGETQTIGEPRDFGGQTVSVLLHSLQGAPTSEDYLVYDEGGVRAPRLAPQAR